MRKTIKELDAEAADMERDLREMKARCDVFDDVVAWELRELRACLRNACGKLPDFDREGKEGE
jgi:hypothetical protein